VEKLFWYRRTNKIFEVFRSFMVAGASIMTIRHGKVKYLLTGLLLSMAASSMAATVTHTVKGEDTLWRVASKYGTSVESLRKMNGLKGSTITAGQKLIVSSNAVTSNTKVASEPVVVKASGSPKVKETVAPNAVAKNAVVKETIRTSAKTTKKPVVAEQQRKAPASFGRLVQVASSSAMVVDTVTGQTLYAKNVDQPRSIASITKLMTAMVSLDANPSMQEMMTITQDDVDTLKHTTSRLPVGTTLSRYEMLRLALMSSENRAASSLSRYYPGGHNAFIAAMNAKAAQLGMTQTRFRDSTGLTPLNVSTAADLVKMVRAAGQYQLIHEFTTTPGREVAIRPHGTPLQYRNSNALVREPGSDWDIKVSKTGYTQEAGRCLVMMASVANHPSVMVMLDSEGKMSPVGDANRLRDWIESGRASSQLVSR
jgi:D-alanyl-D-alanine endopeptidase (penicillin-binding protein 7)